MTRQGVWPDDYLDYPPGGRMAAYLSDGDRDQMEALTDQLAQLRVAAHMILRAWDSSQAADLRIREMLPGIAALRASLKTSYRIQEEHGR